MRLCESRYTNILTPMSATTAANSRPGSRPAGHGRGARRGGPERAPGHHGPHGGPVEVAAAPGRQPGFAPAGHDEADRPGECDGQTTGRRGAHGLVDGDVAIDQERHGQRPPTDPEQGRERTDPRAHEPHPAGSGQIAMGIRPRGQRELDRDQEARRGRRRPAGSGPARARRAPPRAPRPPRLG